MRFPESQHVISGNGNIIFALARRRGTQLDDRRTSVINREQADMIMYLVFFEMEGCVRLQSPEGTALETALPDR